MPQFYGNNMTPQFIEINNITVANYTGVFVSNVSGKWKAYPKIGDMIFVQTTKKLGFSSIELESLHIIELLQENNVIICDKQGLELPVQFMFEPCLDKGYIAYFSNKE